MVVNELGYDVYPGDRAYYKVKEAIPLSDNNEAECSYLIITENGGRIRVDPPFSTNAPYAKGVALRDEGYPGQFGGPPDKISSYWVCTFY